MYELRAVDVLSCAKIAGVFYACLALLFIPMVLIKVVASAGSPQPYSPMGALGLVLLAIFAPVLYGLLGSLFGRSPHGCTTLWQNGSVEFASTCDGIEAQSPTIGST